MGASHANAAGGRSAPSPASTSGAAGAPARPRSAPADVLPPFPAPTIGEVLVLGDEEPMVRLDARRSAIGTLLVHGAVVAVWEATTLETGWCTASGERAGRTVHTPGNRELVALADDGALIALRHLSMLRRAVFVGDTEPLEVDLFDGSHTVVSTGDESTMNVLSITRVGSLLELRAEPLTRPITLDEVVRRFGFVVTGGPTRRERRNG
ncbi:hypothetical protein F8O01_03705 [Pseudoclavibacter chungangensis]|uniref:Uncharacterized protein n=1 Tax=Pseudoclavibacter chungangensis TaxID=587635 RepID=A0A7J5BZK6_9MICO|nr:hypothetical protein [Pseudoclavibacter chungangensis]KAB1660048.1 hypothetical protein F8O01_03705 [Pseudoclavibacter chungangensis]NYJ66858.1 hypothetical protein [Pseudoclavibacter chungangensis]